MINNAKDAIAEAIKFDPRANFALRSLGEVDWHIYHMYEADEMRPTEYLGLLVQEYRLVPA